MVMKIKDTIICNITNDVIFYSNHEKVSELFCMDRQRPLDTLKIGVIFG